MSPKTAFVMLAALSSAAVTGCGSSGGSGIPEGSAATRASLHRAKTCGTLLGDLKADATYKLDHALNQQIQGIRKCLEKYGDEKCAYYGGGYGGGGGIAYPVSAGYDSAESGGAAPPQASPSPGAAGAPTSASSSSSGGTSASTGAGDKSASSYSQTNTQVKGVDEADIVKNDGKNIYVLHGRSFKIVNAWPAADLKEVGSLDIEGDPTEMFVEDGKVVVYSNVNGTEVMKAGGVAPRNQFQDYGYATSGGGYAGGAPTKGAPSVIAEPAPSAPDAPTTPSGPGTTPPTEPGGGTAPSPPVYEPYTPLTKVTVLRLDGTTPVVTREVYFEGSYLDARRLGNDVRSVFQGYTYGPQLKYGIYDLYPTPATKPNQDPASGVDASPNPYPTTGSGMIAALEQLRAANHAIIDASTLEMWLPHTFVREGTAVATHMVACEDFYVPTAGSTESGITEVASLDLSDPSATPRETAILGRADTVYGSADTLYLAAHAWIEPPFSWNDPYAYANGTDVGAPPVSGTGGGTVVGGGTTVGVGAPPAPTPTPPPAGGIKTATKSLRPLNAPLAANTTVIPWSTSNTHIHKFEFKTDPKFANYVASGTVPGSVKDQFSLDDKDGFLRIATTENRQYVSTDGSPIYSDSTPIAKGGLAPERPNTVSHVYVLGQQGPWLETTGDAGNLAPNEQIYSVRFVDNRGYVVTFRQIDPLFVFDLTTPSKPALLGELTMPGFSEYMHPIDANHLLTIGRNADSTGFQRGLQLTIFDVTDGAAPVAQAKFTYDGSEYGSSDAEYDHKAFTYFADKQLLAFPYYAYGTQVANPQDGTVSNGGMRSSLELFKVDVNPGSPGFTKLGSIDSTSLVGAKNVRGYCGGYFAPSVRRGVFLENFVYSISYGGIVAKDVNDLAAAGKEISLPSPDVNVGYGPVCAAY